MRRDLSCPIIMAIEVTSISQPARTLSWRTIVTLFNKAFPDRKLFLRSLLGLLAIAAVFSGDSLLRSYKYYSRVIDARLATGYRTSRAGLYAAPRQIRPGQKISKQTFIQALRRAGYVSSEGSNIWSGSFAQTRSGISIRRARANKSAPAAVQVNFDQGNVISELKGDGVLLESFTLEPEVISNDLSSKTTKREALPFSDVPPVLVRAILAIEDQRFFDHSGLDVFGIARAITNNASDEHSGQGGSTITQQLIKNTYLSPERTFRRKYAEAMLAMALERRLSKQDIFALYCSEIYLGQRGAVAARGVKEAVLIYFGKELKELSLAEAATIAGMIQSPARYSPSKHPEAAHERRNIVIEAMVREGWISRNEANCALAEPLRVTNETETHSVAPYFVDYVDRSSASDFDASPDNSRIFTTLDLELQDLAEESLRRQLDRLKAASRGRRGSPQAALVALDPHTGNVLAMVGGRDYGESQLNRATDARRQPGSTFKPFVYAAALEDGMSPVQMFADEPREFIYDRARIYRPANYGAGYSMHDVPMRTGLVNSLNVVTVDVALQTGLARIANLSESFGLPRPEKYPSLALGTKEVTPLELASAYAAFVNGGRRVEPKVITSVGHPPATHSAVAENSGAQVIKPTTAYMITNMLSAVVESGTGRAARGVGKLTAVAGKTGTSRDGWFVGYTPNLVCVVWIGFDDNEQLGLTGAEAALPAWADFITAAVTLRPELGGKNFECPDGIKFVEIDADLGALSTLSCPHRELIAVTDRLAPNLECLTHGNLHEPIDSEGTAPSTFDRELLLAQHRRSKTESAKHSNFRVDVDIRGKRMLVNDLR